MSRLRICSEFGCGYPQGECLGTCSLLRRVDTHHLPDDRPAFVPGHIEEPAPDIGRARLAFNTFQLYRRAHCGVRESFRNAWRAVRQRS